MITYNQYELFLDSWPKNLKNFLIAWKSGEENLAEYFIKHHKRVRTIHMQTDKTPRKVPLVILKPDLKGCVDPKDSNIEKFRNILPIP